MSAPLLVARGVQVAIRGAQIVEHADVRVDAGRIVAVVGPNGAGKSTFARAVVGLQSHHAGSVEWQGRTLRDWSRRELATVRAFVPQRAPVPSALRVRDAVSMGRAPHLGPLRQPTTADRAAIDRAVELTGVGHLVSRSLATLSGGELQRVRLAVAIAQESPAIVLDEPTASLDLGAAAEMGRLLRRLAFETLGLLVVMHDLPLAAAIADEVVVVDRGRTVAAGPPEAVLTRARLAETWGAVALLDVDGGATSFHVNWLASEATQSALLRAPRAAQPVEFTSLRKGPHR